MTLERTRCAGTTASALLKQGSIVFSRFGFSQLFEILARTIGGTGGGIVSLTVSPVMVAGCLPRWPYNLNMFGNSF